MEILKFIKYLFGTFFRKKKFFWNLLAAKGSPKTRQQIPSPIKSALGSLISELNLCLLF